MTTCHLSWATGLRATSTQCRNLTSQALPRGRARRGRGLRGGQDRILGGRVERGRVPPESGCTPSCRPVACPPRPRPPQASEITAPLLTARSDARGLPSQSCPHFSLMTTSLLSATGRGSELGCVAAHDALMAPERVRVRARERPRRGQLRAQGAGQRCTEATQASEAQAPLHQAEGQLEVSPQARVGPDPGEGTDHVQTQPGPGQASPGTTARPPPWALHPLAPDTTCMWSTLGFGSFLHPHRGRA